MGACEPPGPALIARCCGPSRSPGTGTPRNRWWVANWCGHGENSGVNSACHLPAPAAGAALRRNLRMACRAVHVVGHAGSDLGLGPGWGLGAHVVRGRGCTAGISACPRGSGSGMREARQVPDARANGSGDVVSFPPGWDLARAAGPCAASVPLNAHALRPPAPSRKPLTCACSEPKRTCRREAHGTHPTVRWPRDPKIATMCTCLR